MFGWSVKDKPGDAPDTLKEAPRDQLSIDVDASVENFLVDAGAGRAVASIPDFYFFSGAEGRENRHSLSVAWSPAGRGALAIYDGRYSFEAIAWLDPATRKFSDVGKQLDAALECVVAEHSSKREARRARDHSFAEPIIPSPGVLLVTGYAGSASNKADPGPDFGYHLRFKVTANTSGAVRLELLNAREVLEGDDRTIEDGRVEVELNKVYGQLRAKLEEAARKLLKDEEVKWLKVRESPPADDDIKADFTRSRITELRARARER